ncbi:MAG: hypothetical protein WC554_10480 [Clostridia bacterium]
MKMAIRFNGRNALVGLIGTGIPFILKGAINQFLEDQNIDIGAAVKIIRENKDLLTLFNEYGGRSFEDALHRARNFVNDVSWLTSDWLIDSVRDEHSAIASLFLGWEEAHIWLDLQTAKLREAFMDVNELKKDKPDNEVFSSEKASLPEVPKNTEDVVALENASSPTEEDLSSPDALPDSNVEEKPPENSKSLVNSS